MNQTLESIEQSLGDARKTRERPPLDQWHPELSGDMDLVITRDGQWVFQGKPMARKATAKLFSTILRREDDNEYYLVTPVEKWRIQVEDTPLLAHGLAVKGEGAEQVLTLTTNMGETIEIGEQHPLRVDVYPDTGEPRPVIRVRHGVEARLVTSAFYDLADQTEERKDAGKTLYGVFSRGIFWKIGEGG
ncbi:DUF1285 domain-containing protein [Marinobacter sp. VGCF2001]|uniref:DUF1285 domain-containing protein n=1 Tax=Marinobacter sp. VGCF2001 TaxID=3417189 RepID=UPI003CFBB9AB